jgi:3-oxoacyl-ACP reductase-like protein
MPTPYVKKLAKEKGKSVAEVERLWDKAKDQAEKAGRKDDYAYITGILQHMVGASVSDNQIKIGAKVRLKSIL